MNFSPTWSSCSVVIPGATAARISRRASPTRRPTARIDARSLADWIVMEFACLESHRPFAHQHGAAADANSGRRAIRLVGLDLENAGAPHLEPLLHDPAERAVATGIPRREIAGECDTRASRRRVLGHTDVRRVHPGANVVARVLGVHREHEHLLAPAAVEHRLI